MMEKLISMKEKIKYFFTQQPLPHTGFQLSSSYISGVRISPAERKVKHHFVLPFQGDVIHPSFYKKNMKDAKELEEKLKQGIAELRISDEKIALLLPELAQKAFVFAFDSIPNFQKEMEQILLFRIKKQIPMLPEDTRLSFDVFESNAKKKVLVSVARESVVREYEEFFNKFRLKVRVVGVPSLGLYSLIDCEKEKDFMIIDVEKDSFSLIAVINSEAALYRQKPFAEDFREHTDFDGRWMDVVQEIENTANFIEDKEKRKIGCYWLRIGVLESHEDALALLKERCHCPVKPVESCVTQSLPHKKREILSPLLGQIL
ncbi:MAG: hypothetical protein JXB23_17805 [Candidatus Aminicenantes bacterium]|nr:hypothetical protein [Candidatus Aminicenantes bacterium]